MTKFSSSDRPSSFPYSSCTAARASRRVASALIPWSLHTWSRQIDHPSIPSIEVGRPHAPIVLKHWPMKNPPPFDNPPTLLQSPTLSWSWKIIRHGEWKQSIRYYCFCHKLHLFVPPTNSFGFSLTYKELSFWTTVSIIKGIVKWDSCFWDELDAIFFALIIIRLISPKRQGKVCLVRVVNKSEEIVSASISHSTVLIQSYLPALILLVMCTNPNSIKDNNTIYEDNEERLIESMLSNNLASMEPMHNLISLSLHFWMSPLWFQQLKVSLAPGFDQVSSLHNTGLLCIIVVLCNRGQSVALTIQQLIAILALKFLLVCFWISLTNKDGPVICMAHNIIKRVEMWVACSMLRGEVDTMFCAQEIVWLISCKGQGEGGPIRLVNKSRKYSQLRCLIQLSLFKVTYLPSFSRWCAPTQILQKTINNTSYEDNEERQLKAIEVTNWSSVVITVYCISVK